MGTTGQEGPVLYSRRSALILTTRLDGSEVLVNADLIETIAATPDTVIALIDGSRFVVSESPETIVERIQTFRATVLRLRDEPFGSAATPRLSAVVEPSNDSEA